ncbi:MAG: deoxyribodipyrimidine photo-lyase [Ewingella americana]|jgi:deoxyribodipyrimidine photo-lyase|uniref:deoxyribodipyrimidine photo-lyase n=1 Tax=Ewingella americana TaxID=41202 RepID=UPI002432652F|nr:deoxyribodipyrimidine photo-lyase [Ewingella americana]MCI1676863.1 deoxyribodipyrimidine photo-lyase [Ewingella americana]MCI1853547.1 deoxyribodipyrimidine photo-lyase [Ewingella americana]MCI1860212.1 deoxyribodipyrimidine photo-lyase [Ewingella americana]MCI2164473.1 deoxyribodipyrimidine photo-lyase [Ewingella americana]MCI2211967.1 deoxyribodipyrimidine photo-lyase [Ewingella americana]
MITHLVWFRNDLRITDNRALHAACEDPQAKVIALFIATPKQWQQHVMAPRQAAFIYQHVQALQTSLAERGIPLFYHQCDDFAASNAWLKAFCAEQKVSALFYNRQYEINERERDAALEKLISGEITCRGFDDSLLLPPGSVTTGEGSMYKVYTPFRRAFLERLTESDSRSLPAPQARDIDGEVKLHALTPFDHPQQEIGDDFPVGEEAARDRLRRFCREQVQDYLEQRDLPAIDGTSSLSPYLAIGVLSPRQCFNRLRTECPDVLERRDGGAFGWLNELVWREFYRHLLVAWPMLCKHRPFIDWTDNVRWRHAPEDLQAWKEGKTGYPIVDAAMRQLNATGWMHNRLRMIVASFLVKDLLIDWREGERYFMSQLLDGDLAANNGGWQWGASTGTDAAPYFRIFNPTTQGERFDKAGRFIKAWVPELTDVPEKGIHQPHQWAEKTQRVLDYPQPVIDHSTARKDTLAAFEAAKRGNQPQG